MTVQRNSPSRRNSFAVANKSQAYPGRRRRAHSIAPGDHLSPAAKARRSLAPRKSILKAAANAPDDGDDVTQSMDMTRDYREDNPTRKSLGRRVSFANHAHVRLFEVPDHNTNSTASPQSSPVAEQDPDPPRATNNENVYPGTQRSRRRSSARHSIAFSEGGGEESMDMDSDDTGFSPSAFFRAGAEGSVDDEFDDMDVTEVVPRNIVRRQSLSFGVSRQPLANLSILHTSPHVQNAQDVSNETSYGEEVSSQSQSFTSDGDLSQPMEFTVPLVRPPEPPSEAWLALRSATHSGNTPYIPSSDDDGADDGDDIQEMELTDAVSRLQAARASLGIGEAVVEEGGEGGEDSFTSTEDSFMDEGFGDEADGNQTVNVTQLLRRVSLGPGADSTITSVFSSQEQSREEAISQAVPEIPSIPPADPQGIYPAIPESPEPPTALADPPALYPEISVDDTIPSAAIVPESIPPSRGAVFSAPQHASEAQSTPSENPPQPIATSEPLNFTFTPKPRAPPSPVRSRSSSPAKVPPSPRKFTAAFAPPVTRPSPLKRPNDALDAEHRSQPSPAIRTPGTERLSITPGRGTGAVRVPLSPSKMSPLKMAPFHIEGQHGAGSSKRASIGFRRPSGYFTQRKSLGSAAPDLTTTSRISPIKKAAVLLGRKSIGSIGDSTENKLREDTDDQQPTSLPTIGDPKGLEQTFEIVWASPCRENLTPLPDNQNAHLEHNKDVDWRGEAAEENMDGTQEPQISIEQFFEMTGIRFMDDIAAPRRPIVHPSVFRPSRRASTEAQIPLAEYVIAMAVNVPQLDLYSHVSKDLQTWVERIKEIHSEAEEEVQKATPPLFQEFVTTDESGQAELLHQLKLIKVHNHAQAKSEWYDWKMQWVEQLYQKANEGFKNLEADAKTLEGIIRQAQDIVPVLQKEYDDLMAELAKEQAEVAELEGCDQNYLNELKATIAEQSAELDTYHADVEEAKAKLDRLQEKLNEVESQKKEVVLVVEDAERRIHLQKNSTRAEIFQLKDELEALQSLHMWKATKVLPELFEFTYASSYCISIPCMRFRPVVADIQIRRIENAKMRQPFPLLSAMVLRTANRLIIQHGDQGVREIVQRLGDYWSSCSQVQTQLKLLSIKFPLLIEETPTGFSATATIMFPSHKAKALISFIFDTPVFSSWPVMIQSLRYDARVAYGPIDRDIILNAVTARLRQTSPINNHACLLDTCMEALECFA